MMRRKKTGYYRNIGILILRIGIGTMFILYGYPKVSGGPETWATIGSALGFSDLNPILFGFIAGIIELFGGIFLVLGLFFRPTLVLVILIMAFAAVKHGGTGDGFPGYSAELGIVFFSLLFIGAGRYSIDSFFNKRRQRRLY